MSLASTSSQESAANIVGTEGSETSTTTEVAICRAFHPLENQDSVTVLSLQVPPLQVPEVSGDGERIPVEPKKEAYFDICLDVSGSMAGAGINCAKIAMKRLIDHLINTCGVPPIRITVYLFSHRCDVRRLGDDSDERWINSISAGGGTSFACVFNEIIKNTNIHIREVGRDDVDLDVTLFFFTDGEDGDARNLMLAKENLECLLKSTPRLETAVHTFGFTAGHDAKLLSWLTSTGTNSGCFQYIRESAEIESSMSTTMQLLGNSAMEAQRKIEILLTSDDLQNSQDWIPVKLESDGVSGSTVVRNKSFTGNTIKWREYQPAQQENADATSTSTPAANTVQDMGVEWLLEECSQRIIGMTTFIQHELLRLVESINTIGSSSLSAEEKRASLLEVDAETEAYTKVLGTMTSTAARMKVKLTREPCMVACQRTRSLLQSFLTLKADAHKRGGAISNTSLATFNSLAYGEITEAKLKAKLDSRAGKNTALFADLDQKISNIVEGLDLNKMEAEESEEKLRELSCAFSTNSYVDALRDGDCLCMTLDVSRGAGAIADASQLIIKSIFPTYLTSSMFTMALGHSLSQNNPEDVHGGFDRNIDASIAPGLAHENITAVMPLYINSEHWKVAKLRMKPILGYVVTLDATGYTYSQSTTVPFLVLAKALESSPMSEFRQRQVKLILETCDAIYQSSNTLRETTKKMVQQFCASHTQRTVDVVTNNYVFLGHVICALRAGDITTAEMNELMPLFEAAMVEEQIRRDMSWKVSEDLMGGVSAWFSIDRQRDIVIPGRRYREQHDAYVKALEKDGEGSSIEEHYRELFRTAQAKQGVVAKKSDSASSPTAVAVSLSVAEVDATPMSKPEFNIPDFDPLGWQLSEASLDRLSVIQNAISAGVDKIRRLLAVVQSPLDAELPEVLSSQLGAIAPPNKADEFFARFSSKVNLATLLQAFAHTKNSDRRSVENLMTPFECKIIQGGDSSAHEALKFLKSLHLAKMTQMVNEIVNAVEEEYLDSKKNAAASIFTGTSDLSVAAGVLLESKFRGGDGGVLGTQCAASQMRLPREKIQMLLSGTFNGVQLFSDKSSSLQGIRWFPCKRTLYRMFSNYHDKFTLDEWRQFHPDRYEDYIACRYVMDGYLDELPESRRAEVKAVYAGLWQGPAQ
ncbi:hypothetical protein EDD21DRAFT_373380 [Dissophora ornata]|nr:hypothetical protein EDD21DRAFT_373380 [Dissophora ornata]